MATASLPIAPTGDRKKLVEAAHDAAKAAAKKKYTYGGKTTEGFDCSGFVCYVYKQVFPKFTYLDTGHLESSSLFTVVKEPKPGDLVFFSSGTNPYEVKKNNKQVFPAHVGIVLDDKSWMGSQSSTGVAPVLFKNAWWGARPRKFLRYSGIAE
jgi:cell wall-associated NlpC family hydrolase